MSIVENARLKTIAVNFTVCQPLYLNANFSIEANLPMQGLLCIKDLVDNKIYWINPDHITWIGPRG